LIMFESTMEIFISDYEIIAVHIEIQHSSI